MSGLSWQNIIKHVGAPLPRDGTLLALQASIFLIEPEFPHKHEAPIATVLRSPHHGIRNRLGYNWHKYRR